MRDWRGFSGFLCTPPDCRRVCVCVCTLQDPVTSAAACCDWDMVPPGSPGRDLRTPALYRYRCRFIHALLLRLHTSRSFENQEEKPWKPSFRNGFSFEEETTTKIELWAAAKRFTCSFNIWLSHVWAINFFLQESTSRTGHAVKYELSKINFGRLFLWQNLNCKICNSNCKSI